MCGLTVPFMCSYFGLCNNSNNKNNNNVFATNRIKIKQWQPKFKK